MYLKIRTGRRAAALVATASIAALALAGCAGATPDPATSGGDETIKLFLSYPGEGNVFGPMPELPVSASAAIAAINDAGGVKGRELELVSCNHDLVQDKAINCARDAADPVTGTVAVVGSVDLASTITFPILEEAGIPSVGYFSWGTPYDLESPANYPINGGIISTWLALPLVAQEFGYVRVAVQNCEYPSCKAPLPTIADLADEFDYEYVGDVEVPDAGAPDFAPFATRIQALDPDLVAQISSPAIRLNMITAGDAIDFRPTYYGTPEIGEKEAAAAGKVVDGDYSVSPVPSPRSLDLEVSKTYVDERAAYDDVTAQEWLDQEFTLSWMYEFNTWLAVHATALAIEKIEGDDVTAEALTAVLDDPATSIDIPGYITWTPGVEGPTGYARFPNMPAYLTSIEDGQYVTVRDEPLDVAEVAELVN